MATEVTFIRSGGLSLREQLARGGGVWGVGGWWRWITQSFPMRPPTPLHPALSPTITVSCVPGQVPRSLWSGSSKSGQKQSPLQAQGGRKMSKSGWAGSHSCRCKECFPREPVKSCSAGLVTRKGWAVKTGAIRLTPAFTRPGTWRHSLNPQTCFLLTK